MNSQQYGHGYNNKNSATIVYVRYDKRIAKLADRHEDTFALQDPANFDALLMRFFEMYPAVFEKAIPGTLIQKVNGAPAVPAQALFTGDMVEMELMSTKELRDLILQDLQVALKGFRMKIRPEEIVKEVFEATNDNPDEFIDKFTNKETKMVEDDLLYYEDLLFKVFNSFPQKRLGGKSQMEVLHEELMNEFKKLNTTQIHINK